MNASTPPRSSALIVFAKTPAPGEVKTRLTELLTEEEAAGLYEAFLQDALAQYAALAERCGAALRLYHDGPDWPAHLAPQGASLHRQRGTGLGARMAAAFCETFDAGARSALILGTDHPTLPPAFIEKGLDVVQRDREAVCLGPSADGGFYLLGMARFRPALFEDMTYSHAGVFEQTLARAAEAAVGAPVVLPAWYDVDRPADLRRLAAGLAADGSIRAPRTRRRVQRLLEQYPALRSVPPHADNAARSGFTTSSREQVGGRSSG